jgi:hypothetical protein
MADQQGTGKHPHKSSEEPYPHHQGGQHASSEHSNRSGTQSESGEDLKDREYRDEQGNIHHHTRTSEEQHKR